MHRALLSAVLSLSVLRNTVVAAQDASYTFTTIDVPFSDALATIARGINNQGQIVGYYIDSPASRAHGFRYATEPFGINNRGQIVGLYIDPGGTNPGQHGFRYAAGVFTPLDVPFSNVTGTAAL